MANPYELLAGLALLREKKRSASQSRGSELQEWSGFQMRFGELDCLIPREQVEEVVTPAAVAGVRGVPAWIRGIIFSHAQLVTLIDVGRLWSFNTAVQAGGRVFVVRGAKEWFGLQSATFEGVRHIWSDTPDCAPPRELTGEWLDYIREWLLLDGHPVAVLDAARLVQALEQREAGV